jgi:hypothetical protein
MDDQLFVKLMNLLETPAAKESGFTDIALGDYEDEINFDYQDQSYTLTVESTD